MAVVPAPRDTHRGKPSSWLSAKEPEDEKREEMPVDRHKIESFLYREARLMDEHAYDEWLALWTDDALYWVPCNEDDFDPERHVSIVYENKARLEAASPGSKAGRPMPRTRNHALAGSFQTRD